MIFQVVFSNENFVVIDIPTQNDAEPSTSGSCPEIGTLEYFPENILLQIFSEVDDQDLLHLSDCSHRFAGIAKIVFKMRYARKYFVFDGDTKTARKMYGDLFERFGRHANIKAVKIKSIRNMDANHWIAKLLIEYTEPLEKLAFVRCWFKGINEILSQHINITHLTIRLSAWHDPFGIQNNPLDVPNYRLTLPDYRNLKQLEVSYKRSRSLCDGNTILRTMRNNPGLEVLNLSLCNPIVPIDCIAENLKNLKGLNLIGSMEISSWTTKNMVVESLKQLESLGLTIYDERHINLVKRLSLNCKNLKHLELDHYRHEETISCAEIVAAAAQFQTVESLEFLLLRNQNAIQTLAEYLPNLHRLRRLKIFMDEPQDSDAIIATLLNASPTLKTITINTWDHAPYESLLNIVLNRAVSKVTMKAVWNPPQLLRDEFKQFQNEIGSVTSKTVTRRDGQIHWVENSSIFYSYKLCLLNFVAYYFLSVLLVVVGISTSILAIQSFPWTIFGSVILLIIARVFQSSLDLNFIESIF